MLSFCKFLNSRQVTLDEFSFRFGFQGQLKVSLFQLVELVFLAATTEYLKNMMLKIIVKKNKVNLISQKT